MSTIDVSCPFDRPAPSPAPAFGLSSDAAQQLASELEQRRQSEELLRRSNQRLALLSDVASQLLMSSEPQKIVNSLCQKVLPFLDCHAFFNYLVNEERNCLHLNTCGGIPEDVARQIEWLDYGAAVCGCAARDACRIVAENIPTTPDPRTDLVKSFGIQAYACHPLFSQGKVLGTLSFGTRSRTRFSDEDLAMMKAVADHIAIAMERIIAQEELRRAKEAAESASKAKDHFLAVLSHELRTPLTPALMSASVLLRDKSLSPEAREDIEVIRRNVEMEARLIDDLLDLTRITRGKLELHQEIVDVHACLRAALDICRAEIEQKELAVAIATRAGRHHVWGDFARLQQVFWNLLKNAAKFTPHGGRIDIRTSNDERGRLAVQIRDNGTGIEPEAISRIFNAFEQAEKTLTRQFGGLGLGLTISKTLVELHHGRITAHSEGKGQGAVFTVEFDSFADEAELPAPASPASAPLRLVPASARKPLRILLVEDHADTRRIVSSHLRSAGYAVKSAENVHEALALAAGEPFDLLISDIGLPDGTGLDVIRQVKERYGLRGIALSGFGMQEDVLKSKAAGFEHHFTKPVDFQLLQEVIERIAS